MRTLVLNAGFEPLAVVSFKRAIVLVMNDKATVLAADDEHPVVGSFGAVDRPSVILLTRYVRIPTGRMIPVSRRGVLRRDNQRCAYCGRSASTIDHVLPRSRRSEERRVGNGGGGPAGGGGRQKGEGGARGGERIG